MQVCIATIYVGILLPLNATGKCRTVSYALCERPLSLFFIAKLRIHCIIYIRGKYY